MKRKLLIGALVALTVINVAGLLTMGFCRFQHYCMMARLHTTGLRNESDPLHSQLDLSTEQRAQIQKLKETLQAELARLRPALRAKREELADLLMASEPERARVEAAVQEFNALQAQVQRAVVQHLLDEKKLLSPAQQEKFLATIRRKLAELDPPSASMVPPAHHE